MRKYEFENATVYITEPTEKHIENIKKATEMFAKRVMKEKMKNESRRYNRRTGFCDIDAGRRNQ